MIERLQLIATHLTRFRLYILLLAMLSFALLLLSLLDVGWSRGDSITIPAILCFTWAVTLFSVSAMFSRIPAQPASSAGWRTRLSYRIRRASLWLLALLFVALTLSLLILSYQLLRAGSVG